MPLIHASAVAYDGRGILILGPSGSGKSSLALEMMSRGAVLVADDQVVVETREGEIWLEAPEPLRGRIEARGVGLLQAASGPAQAVLIVDLGQTETERLPPHRTGAIAGAELPLLYKVESPAFAAMLIAYLRGGRCA